MDNKKRLKDLLLDINVLSLDGNLSAPIAGVAVDSKAVRENHCFIAVKGTSVDGHSFIKEAVERGVAICMQVS